jgi:xylulokinase
VLHGAPERSEGALFLPYLNGERCPVQETRPMGTFVQLGTRSGPAQVGWAVVEGICFALRQVLETLGAAAQARDMRMLGGMARSPLLRQLVADCCNRAVVAPRLPQAAGAMAAAVPVAVARGWFPSAASAVAQWFPARDAQGAAAEPDPHWAAHYAAAYQRYCRIYPLISQIA